MAEIVDELPRARAGTPHMFPWEQWLDGRVWKLTRGTDFQVSAESFRRTVAMAATRMNMDVETRVHGDSLFLQASRA